MKHDIIITNDNKKVPLTFSNVDRLDWAFLACIGNGIPTPDPGGGGGGGGAPEIFRGLLGTVATAVSLCDAKVDLFVCWPGEAGGPPPPWLLAKEPGPPLLPFLGPVVGATTPRGFALLTPVGPITDDCGGGFKF